MSTRFSIPVKSPSWAANCLGVPGLLLLLAGCQPTQAPVQPQPQPVRAQATVTDNTARRAEEAFREEIRQQLVLADLLYEGQRALAEDRLMTPPENSAMSKFNRALALQPGNPVALQGIQDVAGRYLQLAETAARQGQFDNADQFLRRADMVAADHPGLPAARTALATAREQTHSVHTLNASDLNRQTAGLVEQLQQIARQVRDNQAFVMITAPNDAQGRWIYTQMQSALEGYRLRGNIEIGQQPSIRLVLQPGRGNS